MSDAFQLPANGVGLVEARVAIERLRGLVFTNRSTRQHGHHIYSVEAIKLEALERKVEVVSGYTPHASSASTQNIIAKAVLRIKRVFASLGFPSGTGS